MILAHCGWIELRGLLDLLSVFSWCFVNGFFVLLVSFTTHSWIAEQCVHCKDHLPRLWFPLLPIGGTLRLGIFGGQSPMTVIGSTIWRLWSQSGRSNNSGKFCFLHFSVLNSDFNRRVIVDHMIPICSCHNLFNKLACVTPKWGAEHLKNALNATVKYATCDKRMAARCIARVSLR